MLPPEMAALAVNVIFDPVLKFVPLNGEFNATTGTPSGLGVGTGEGEGDGDGEPAAPKYRPLTTAFCPAVLLTTILKWPRTSQIRYVPPLKLVTVLLSRTVLVAAST